MQGRVGHQRLGAAGVESVGWGWGLRPEQEALGGGVGGSQGLSSVLPGAGFHPWSREKPQSQLERARVTR